LAEAEGPSASSLLWPLLLPGREDGEVLLAMEKATPAADEKGLKKGLPAQGTGNEVSDDTAHQISTGLSFYLNFVILFHI
jgi:hypothetical protein